MSEVDWLRTLGPAKGDASRAARGVTATLAWQAWRLLIQVGGTLALARLLSPADFGLVGMVLAVTALADQLKDMGLANAVITRRELSQAHVSALFWVNVGLGGGLTLAICGLGPALAAFFGQPELALICVGMSFSYAITGLGVQHNALLLRDQRYGALAARDGLAHAAGAAVGVAAAFVGFGYWSLVVLYLTTTVVRTTTAWTMCSWRPGPPQLRVPGLRSYLSFGGHLSGFTVLNYLSRNLDNLLVGRFFGPTALGLYGRAYSLILLPLQQVIRPIGTIVISSLSRLVDDPPAFRRLYRSAISCCALFGLPCVVVLALISERAVPLLLGEQWLDAVAIFQLLALAGGVQVVSSTTGWLYIATGHTARMLRWALVTRPITALGFVAGLPWGPEGVAAAYSVVTAILLVPSMLNAAVGTAIERRDWVLPIGQGLGVAAVVAAVTGLAIGATGGAGASIGVAVPVGVACISYVGALAAWPGARRQVLEIVAALRERPAAR